MSKAARGFAFPIYVRREAITLTLLTGLAILLFLLVSGISGIFHVHQQALGERWATRGADDLNAHRYKAAAAEFRTALLYSHDDFAQQLGLAEALIGMKRIPEAEVYLVNLWDQEPENGIVNRELARIAAGKNNSHGALRYYHNAIYATWPAGAENQRVQTRWELIKYLLTLDARAQAQSELIALDAEVGGNPDEQLLLGQYFLKVQDDPHALESFRKALAADPHSERALAGAGTADFNMANYTGAQYYLRRALAEHSGDRDAALRLETTEQIVHMNPFRGSLSDDQRAKAAIAAFAAAGSRLQSCPAAGTTLAAVTATPPAAAPANSKPKNPAAPLSLGDAWNQMRPMVTVRSLRGNPDRINQTMDLVFAIERQANGKCGAGTPSDMALLLIEKLHEGS